MRHPLSSTSRRPFLSLKRAPGRIKARIAQEGHYMSPFNIYYSSTSVTQLHSWTGGQSCTIPIPSSNSAAGRTLGTHNDFKFVTPATSNQKQSKTASWQTLTFKHLWASCRLGDSRKLRGIPGQVITRDTHHHQKCPQSSIMPVHRLRERIASVQARRRARRCLHVAILHPSPKFPRYGIVFERFSGSLEV